MHLLVAAFVGYQAPPDHRPAQAEPDEDDSPAGPAPWMTQSMGVIPGPEAAKTAATPAEGLAAFERALFGEVKDVSQI